MEDHLRNSSSPQSTLSVPRHSLTTAVESDFLLAPFLWFSSWLFSCKDFAGISGTDILPSNCLVSWIQWRRGKSWCAEPCSVHTHTELLLTTPSRLCRLPQRPYESSMISQLCGLVLLTCVYVYLSVCLSVCVCVYMCTYSWIHLGHQTLILDVFF